MSICDHLDDKDDGGARPRAEFTQPIVKLSMDWHVDGSKLWLSVRFLQTMQSAASAVVDRGSPRYNLPDGICDKSTCNLLHTFSFSFFHFFTFFLCIFPQCASLHVLYDVRYITVKIFCQIVFLLKISPLKFLLKFCIAFFNIQVLI